MSVNLKSGVPIYVQIMNQVEEFASLGVLKAGDPLPTIRSLANELEVNPNTVARAYRDLEARGILASRRGVGTCVADSVRAGLDGEAVIQQRLRELVSLARGMGIKRETVLALVEESFSITESRSSEVSELSSAVSVEFID